MQTYRPKPNFLMFVSIHTNIYVELMKLNIDTKSNKSERYPEKWRNVPTEMSNVKLIVFLKISNK